MNWNRQRSILTIILILLIIYPSTVIAQYDMNFNMAVKQGTGRSNTDLEGSTFYFSSFGFYDLQSSGVTSETNWGTMVFDVLPSNRIDAAGSDYSSNGGSGLFSATGTFNVNDNGIVDLNIGNSPQTDPGKGYLSANLEYMAIRHATTWTTPPTEVMLKAGLGIKRDGMFVAADLNGTFYLKDMEIFEIGTTDRHACILDGTVEFSAPNYTVSYTSTCSDGSTESDSESGTFSMNSDGSFTLSPSDGSRALPCQLSTNKNVFVTSIGREQSVGGSHNGMAVGIRASGTAYTNADLNGTYHFSEMHIYDMEAAQDADRDGTVSWGTATFDGNGGFTYTVAGMDPDASTHTGSGGGTYAMNTNGDFQFNVTEQDGAQSNAMFSGHLARDGELLVMTRAEDPSSPAPAPTPTPDNSGSGGSSGGGGGGGCFIQSLLK